MTGKQLALGACVAAFLGTAGPAWAGPNDMSTLYWVRMNIGGKDVPCVADTGGTTSLSFADAVACGILDGDGNPVNPPSGSIEVGGNGAGGTKSWTFDNVEFKIQAALDKAEGVGIKVPIKAKIAVPKKPDLQSGNTPEERKKKSDATITKIGRNVVGGTWDGNELRLIDVPDRGNGPDGRGTVWGFAPHTNPDRIPIQPDPEPINPDLPRWVMPNVKVGNASASGLLLTCPVTFLPESMAGLAGFTFTNMHTIDSPDILGSLFAEGLLGTLPGDPAPQFQEGLVDITFDAESGPLTINGVSVMLVPGLTRPLFGANAIAFEWYQSSLDEESMHWEFSTIPTPGALTMLGVAVLGSRRVRARCGRGA